MITGTSVANGWSVERARREHDACAEGDTINMVQDT